MSQKQGELLDDSIAIGWEAAEQKEPFPASSQQQRKPRRARAKPELPAAARAFSSPPSNQLSRAPTSASRYKADSITGALEWEGNGTTIRVENNGKPLNGEALCLHDFLLMCLTPYNDLKDKPAKTEVDAPFAVYAQLRGKDGKTERQRLRVATDEALNGLFNTEVTWDGKYATIRGRIMSSVVKPKLTMMSIQCRFTDEYIKCVTSFGVIPINRKMFQLDQRNPIIYPLCRKLHEIYYSEKLRKAGHHNMISIKALIEALPSLPTIEEVRAKDRALFQKIMQPLLDSLETATEAGIIVGPTEWVIEGRGGRRITEEELAKWDYATLNDCYLRFALPEAKKLEEAGQLRLPGI